MCASVGGILHTCPRSRQCESPERLNDAEDTTRMEIGSVIGSPRGCGLAAYRLQAPGFTLRLPPLGRQTARSGQFMCYRTRHVH